ncbi:MAG: tetratricopeptide repeat protein [Actinobacteria bacterium]|jgi:TPR repeat protein|nr:tetratricopeptide repeat protein [Actinomycetota bacterium]
MRPEDLDSLALAAASAEDWDLLVDLGCRQFDSGNLSGALDSFTRAVTEGRLYALINVGNCHYEMGDYSQAAEWFGKAEAAGDTTATYNLALALEHLDRSAEQVDEVLTRAASAGDAKAAIDLAFRLRARGEYSTALMHVAEAAAAGDELAAAISSCWRWDATHDSGLEAALRRGQSRFPSARADLAELLVLTGRRQEGMDVLRTGVAEGELDSFVPLANMLEDDGDLTGATQLLRAAAELGDGNARENLERLLRGPDG